jgi:uncharacterized membrane protein YhaH (DUF805 family)
VSFGDSIKTCFTKYVVFQGRASRPEYWWFLLSYVVLYVVFAALRMPAIYGLIGLVYFIPLISAAVRRLHDTGRSGWWYLIGLVPLVGWIILIVFLASQGEAGQNAYGAPPGGPAAAMGSGAVPPPPPPA